ncbi:MAG TPA: GNAT family N-acetyltransferase [Ktedonobacteraceae bacterium]|nr:GNAT family N-acetyltransferase [Ktedonobacteraceae bacterium]
MEFTRSQKRWSIIDLQPQDETTIRQVAALLVEGFATNWPDAWPDLASALECVREFFESGRISRVARDEDGTVLGWIGGNSQYNGHVWELHPLVVRISSQGKGIGRALVQDLERLVKERGGLTILVGTDDENDLTTLSGVNLFSDVYTHITNIKNLKKHPYEFYQKLGFVIVGVVPDANGLGKPDILMAKSMVR